MGQDNGMDASTFIPAGAKGASSTGMDPSTFRPDLTPTPGKGIYAMEDKDGTQIGVSFDKVDKAGKNGYKFSDKITVPNAKSREDYAKDRFAALQPNANTKSIGTKGNLLEGRFFKGGKIVPQTPIPEQVEGEPGAWQGTREWFKQKGTPTGADRPVSPSKTNSLVDSVWNAGANLIDETKNITGIASNNVFGMVDTVPQIISASKDALSYDPYKATTGLATLMQMMPALMAKNYVDHLKEVTKQNPTYAVDDVIGTTIAFWAGGKLAEKGVKAVSDPVGTFKSIKEAPNKIARSAVEGLTKTSPREVKALAEEVQKTNAIAQEHNQRVLAKHKAVSERIQQGNTAAEHTADLRHTEEAQLQQETDAYYAKEDAVKAKVKTAADAKWKPVHTSLDAKTIDGGNIENPLAKITAISPEVTREINQLVPDPEDAAPDSMYAKDRAAVMKGQGYDPGDYWKISADQRANIDKICASSGFTPEPIDLDPKVGVGIPFDKVHRAQSIIGRNIRNGRYGYEGPLLGEMTQLRKVLYNAESKIAADNGMSADLNEARKATREYQEAFGTQRNTPKNQVDLRKQQANPEQFKEENEQERVDAAKRHDPSLASDYEKVKAHRETIKKMQTEDQLRKAQKQVPPPPTIDDLRGGYRLKPTDEQADLHTRKEENIPQGAEELRKRGLGRALNALFYTVPTAIFSVLLGHPGYAIAEFSSFPVIMGGSNMVASLLEKPEVVSWLSKINDKDVEAFNKLPPEQRAVFTQDMKDLADAAKKKGVAVSPVFSRFVNKPLVKGAIRVAGGYAGVANANKPSLEEIKKQAQDLHDQMYKGGLAPAPATTPPLQEATPDPQSSLRPTHIFNATKGIIEAA